MLNLKVDKAFLLSIGEISLNGWNGNKAKAGPGAGKEAIFLKINGKRVRLVVSDDSPLEGTVRGNHVDLVYEGRFIGSAEIEKPVLHSPENAYITVSERCIFRCRFCDINRTSGGRKSIDDVVNLIKKDIDNISSISITSGIMFSPEEEVRYVSGIVDELARFGKPLGVSVYPSEESSHILRESGADEIKYNLEVCDRKLFRKYCPDKDFDFILRSLSDAVEVFGEGNVFSNIIVGLGESDRAIKSGIDRLVGMGVIPNLRPYSPGKINIPSAGRPSRERIHKLATFLKKRLDEAGLLSRGQTMCHACGGCDLSPLEI